MSEKVLLVDDDSNVLDGFRRSLCHDFSIETAQGGKEALAMVSNDGPYAVVVSDMRQRRMLF